MTSFCAFAQTKKDTIITELKLITADSGHSMRKKSDSTKIIIYQLCGRWSEKVNYLTNNLTQLEIAELENDKNASINIIGLISKLENNNTKEFAIEQINALLKKDIKFMNSSCSDAITTNSISRYLLYLMTYENPFFKPKFKLRKREIKKLENKILIAETKFWYDM